MVVILSVELSRAERGSPATMRQRDLWNGSVGTERNSCLNRGYPAKTVVISMCWTTGRISHHMSGGDLPPSFHQAEPRRASAYAIYAVSRRHVGTRETSASTGLRPWLALVVASCELAHPLARRRLVGPHLQMAWSFETSASSAGSGSRGWNPPQSLWRTIYYGDTPRSVAEALGSVG